MASDTDMKAVEHGGDKSLEMVNFQLTELKIMVRDIAKKMDLIQEYKTEVLVWKERIENRLTDGNKTMNDLQKQAELNERKAEHQISTAREMAIAVEKLAQAKAKEIEMIMKEKFHEIDAAISADSLSKVYVRKDTVKWILIGMTAAGGAGGALIHQLFQSLK